MVVVRESRIVDLIPTRGDGVTVTFTTPTPFAPGTLRLLVNGTEYGPTEDDFGFAEINSTTIQVNTPPRAGDDVDAFYIEETGAPLGVGSPFGPGEVC